MCPPVEKEFQHALESTSKEARVEDKEPTQLIEMEKKLSLAMDEIQVFQSKMNLFERYASILHRPIFRKPLEEMDLPL